MVHGDDIFELRLFDEVLLRFSFGDFEPAVLLEHDRALEHLMPLGLELTNEGLWRWLSRAPFRRTGGSPPKLCRSLGLSPNDRGGILMAGMGLSLNDSYWIAPDGFTGTFFRGQPLRKRVFVRIGRRCVHGRGQRHARHDSCHARTHHQRQSAESVAHRSGRNAAALQGVFRCACGIRRGARGVSRRAGGRCDGLDAVAYGLGSWSGAAGDVCSTCDCFCTKEVSYVPQALAFGDTAHTAAVRTYLR